MTDPYPIPEIRKTLSKKRTIMGLTKPTWYFVAGLVAFVVIMAVFSNVFGS